MAILNPLTAQHCSDMDTVLGICPHIRDTLNAMQECGLDCTEQLQTLDAQQEIASKIKQKFNPLST